MPDAASCCAREIEGFSQRGEQSSGSQETSGPISDESRRLLADLTHALTKLPDPQT